MAFAPVFRFPEMAAWYEANRDNPALFENAREVVAYLIEPAQKYEKQHGSPHEHITNFVKQRIGTDHVRRLRFIREDTESFPHGVFVLPASSTSLFFIFPKYKPSKDIGTGADKQILVADHFSFPYQRGLTLTNVHKTSYIPTDTDYRLGFVGHAFQTQLRDGTAINQETFHRFRPQDAHVHAMATAHLQPPVATGGGRTVALQRPPSLTPVPAKPLTLKLRKAPALTPVSASLQAALESCHVCEVTVFCIRDKDHWAITVCLSYTTDILNRIGFYMEAEHLHWNAIEAQLIRSLNEYRTDILTVYESDEPDDE